MERALRVVAYALEGVMTVVVMAFAIGWFVLTLFIAIAVIMFGWSLLT